MEYSSALTDNATVSFVDSIREIYNLSILRWGSTQGYFTRIRLYHRCPFPEMVMDPHVVLMNWSCTIIQLLLGAVVSIRLIVRESRASRQAQISILSQFPIKTPLPKLQQSIE